MPDDELLRRLIDLLRQSRHDEADLVAHIGEVDARRLYAREASPSMFVYCTEVLHLSEAEAYLRITAARASRQRPVLLDMLRDGRLHLSGIARLVGHLTDENASTLLPPGRSPIQAADPRARCRSRSTTGCSGSDSQAAGRGLPRPDTARAKGASPLSLVVPPSPPPRAKRDWARANYRWRHPVAGLPPFPTINSVRTEFESRSSAPSGGMEPLAPGRYKVQFTASAGFHDKLERLQALMRGRVPEADLATIIEAAVTETLERLEAKRFALTRAPRKGLRETNTIPASRHIPAAVRRAVHERDGGRCGYRDERGRQCPERVRLEFHHRHPFGYGGDHSPENVGLSVQGPQPAGRRAGLWTKCGGAVPRVDPAGSPAQTRLT